MGKFIVDPFDRNDNNVRKDDIGLVSALARQIEEDLNTQVDKIIDQKTEEFRQELIREKSMAIAKIIRNIEISAQPDMVADSMSVMIRLRPKY